MEQATNTEDTQPVILPTHGMALEARLGQCNACEEYIQESRYIDLKTRCAKARQEEAEARRREKLLTKSPPDLSEFDKAVNGTMKLNFEAASSDS